MNEKAVETRELIEACGHGSQAGEKITLQYPSYQYEVSYRGGDDEDDSYVELKCTDDNELGVDEFICMPISDMRRVIKAIQDLIGDDLR